METATSIPRYLWPVISHVDFSANTTHQTLKPKARFDERKREEYYTRSSTSERLEVREHISSISWLWGRPFLESQDAVDLPAHARPHICPQPYPEMCPERV